MRPLVPALIVAVGTALFAQQPTRDEVTVSLVEVPVYLETLTGRELKPLTRANFELFVNGKRQEIEHFEMTSSTTEAAAEPVPLDRRHLTVLVFDNYRTSFASAARGKAAATKMIENASPSHAYAIATVSRRGLEFVTPFTGNKRLLADALSTSAKTQVADPFRLAAASRPTLATDSYREMLGRFGGDIWGDSSFGGFRTTEVIDPSTGMATLVGISAAANEEFARIAAGHEAEYDSTQDELIIGYLAEVADRLAPIVGLKNVVFLSEMGHLSEEDPGDARRYRLRMNQIFKNVHDRYRAAGVVLDAVDLANLRAPWTSASADMPQVLATLAGGTGGTATHSLNALEARQKSSYVLAFQPRGPQQPMNSIRVKVKKVPFGTIVRHRKGYSATATPDRGKDDGLFLADVLMNDIPQNGISVDVVATEEAKRTQVAVKIPGIEMLARPVDGPLLLDSFLYLFNEKNDVVAWTYDRLSLDLQKGEDYLRANDYEIVKEFNLPPGKFSAKSLVRFAGTELAGFKRIDVDVREPQ